jgi:hypothetical protein
MTINGHTFDVRQEEPFGEAADVEDWLSTVSEFGATSDIDVQAGEFYLRRSKKFQGNIAFVTHVLVGHNPVG